MSSTKTRIFLILLCLFFQRIHAHATCVWPRTRGSLVTNAILNNIPKNGIFRKYKFKHYRITSILPNNCPHCANGGGKGGVMKAANGKWFPYEPTNPKLAFRRDHGMCGDAISAPTPRNHEFGGKWGYPKSPIVAHYKTGQTVEFVVDVTTNHNGWFDFFICDVTKCGGDINEKCFKNGHCHTLMREKTAVCESQKSMECAPVDEKYPGRWYLPCRKKGFEHFMGGPYMRYKLPKGFSSKHAVIQFYWVTANSCNPPGHLDYFKRYPMKAWGNCIGDGGALGGRNTMLAECGPGGFPEEFWGCADVSVGTGEKSMTAGQSPKMGVHSTVAGTPPPPPPKPFKTKNTPQPKAKLPQVPVMPMVTHEPAMPTVPEVSIEPEITVSRKCQINWRQCAGKYHKGPFGCCNPTFYCHRVNMYYSQCRRKKL